MSIWNLGKFYKELSRMWAVNKIFTELILDEFVSRLYRGKGLARRSLGKRFLAGLIRRILRRERGTVPFPVAFRKALERLGPTYVKFGQILSLRSDFLPDRITRELRKLQAQVPSIPFHEVKRVIEQEFKMPLTMIFKEFDEAPLAAASLAQTHIARLKNGTKVVVKVQRPGIVSLIKYDISIMRRMARLGSRIPVVRDYNPSNIVEEFANYTFRELDFSVEGKNADKFSHNFRDWPDVQFPNIFWEYTSTRVLTMEFIPGIPPDSDARLKKAKIDTKKLAVRGTHAILKMLYIDGFFHGDPHPGNLFVVDRTNIAFIDLGMIGSFSKEVKRNMFLYFYNMVIQEFEHATKYLVALCVPGPRSDEAGFRRELSEKIATWSGAGFKEYSLGNLILETMNIGAKYRLYFHGDLVLMSKCLITIEAVGNILDPDLDIAKVSEPFMQKIFLDQFSPVEIGKKFLNAVPDYMKILETLPATGLDLVENIQKGVVTVRVDDSDEGGRERLMGGSGRYGRRSGTMGFRGYPFLSAACLLSGSILAIGDKAPGGYIDFIRGLEDFPLMAGVMFLTGGFFGLVTLWSNYKFGKAASR